MASKRTSTPKHNKHTAVVVQTPGKGGGSAKQPIIIVGKQDANHGRKFVKKVEIPAVPKDNETDSPSNQQHHSRLKPYVPPNQKNDAHAAAEPKDSPAPIAPPKSNQNNSNPKKRKAPDTPTNIETNTATKKKATISPQISLEELLAYEVQTTNPKSMTLEQINSEIIELKSVIEVVVEKLQDSSG